MATSTVDERRLRIAQRAYDLIVEEVRPFLASGGRLWSKGSRGYPSRLRHMLGGLELKGDPRFATPGAMELARSRREVEHVVPVKRIVIEIVDPAQADPRCNDFFGPIAGGPAESAEDVIAIHDRLFDTCWVTPAEHRRLNRVLASFQWDAPNGNGWKRYEQAGVSVFPISPQGQLLRD